MFYTSLPELKKLERQNLAHRREAFRALASLFRRKPSGTSTELLEDGTTNRDSEAPEPQPGQTSFISDI